MPSACPSATPQRVGLYIHQHWPYNHPYAARTWSVQDYRAFLGGLRQIGYDLVMIWPVLETMPQPLMPSDRACIGRLAEVIDLAHHELDMRVWLTLCPNVAAVDEIALRAPFEERHYFYSDRRVNPGDPAAMAEMMQRREEILRPLRHVDAIVTIDSDPGGYVGSSNAEFVRLLREHRRLYDRLRPGIELYYWAEHGWPTYCRFYEQGYLDLERPGREQEFEEAMGLLRDEALEPWGLACSKTRMATAARLGLAGRVMGFNYGAIEYEPSFPCTHWWLDRAHAAGAQGAARGVMGNAQTHALQLPNILAFAEGAGGRPLSAARMLEFAEGLIPGRGDLVVAAWTALEGTDPDAMRELIPRLQGTRRAQPAGGPLRGLLFNDPQRFLQDLILQLRFRAAWETFAAALARGAEPWPRLAEFVTAAEAWQLRHGYQDTWWWPGMEETLRRLGSLHLNRVFDAFPRWFTPPAWQEYANAPFDECRIRLFREETGTLRLLDALKKAILTQRGEL